MPVGAPPSAPGSAVRTPRDRGLSRLSSRDSAASARPKPAAHERLSIAPTETGGTMENDFSSELIDNGVLLAASPFLIAWYVIVAIALWRVFSKAGYAGILALIPIVNLFILSKVAGYSAWMTFLYLIPIVGFIFGIFIALRLGERFNKGALYSIFFLWLITPIGYLMLGLGRAQYVPRR